MIFREAESQSRVAGTAGERTYKAGNATGKGKRTYKISDATAKKEGT